MAYREIESVQALDARTARVTWARPFIDADKLFTRTMAPPLPKHLLGEIYAADKAGLAEHPYWTEQFVGAGPFTLREWVRGSHLVAAANDGYVLGRPKLDEVEVRFIRDPNALVANILAGAVELTLGRNLTLDPAIQVRDQWRDGAMEIAVKSWIVVYPQFINPNPAVVGDVRFRRALMHAADRQQMADSLQNGLVPVAHAMISPSEPIYAQLQDSVVRYEYDPRRAMQLVEEIGYARGADGGYRDAGGQRLGVEIRVLGGDDFPEKAMFSVADAWNRVGITTDPVVVAAQRERDAEYRSNFPGFSLHRQPNELANLEDFRAAEIPLAENNYLGRNRGRYRNSEFEVLIQRYFSTVPTGERIQVVRQVIHHMTDTVNVLGMIYSTEPTLIGSRLVNVTARTGEQGSTHAWNAEQWDVR